MCHQSGVLSVSIYSNSNLSAKLVSDGIHFIWRYVCHVVANT